MSKEMGKGKVWLVGAGPSDQELLTLKAARLIKEADVIVYDKLVGDGILSTIPTNTKTINVGKVAGNHPVPQHEINQILLKEALDGKKVVRLKGGDPFVFGRGGEELELLVENQIPFEIVPGITSAVSVPAYNGIPVTHRDFTSSFHVITGHTKSEDEANVDYESLVKLDGTLIFLMGIGSMSKICNGLIDAGMAKDMPAAVLEKGTTSHQRRVVSTVEKLYEDSQKAKIKTQAIIIVGKVCSLAEEFAWAEKRPLAGLKIAVTRPRDRASKLADQLVRKGAEVVLMPAIKTVKIPTVLDDLNKFTWLGFTSPAGVEIFFEILKDNKIDIRSLLGIKIAAIGSGTAKAVEKLGMKVDVIPEKYNGEAMGKLLAETLTKDDKILIARAKIGTSEVIKPLEEKGIEFVDLSIYDTLYEEENNVVAFDETIDLVTFTSASTVKSFVANNKNLDFAKVKALCIGEQTAEEASKHNMQVQISEKATIASMVEYLVNNKEKFLK